MSSTVGSPEWRDAVGRTRRQVSFINLVMKTLFSGIQIFLVVYGLSVYLSTPRELRKGRKPYIFLSFLITLCFCVSTVLDGYFAWYCLTRPPGPYDDSIPAVLETFSLRGVVAAVERQTSIFITSILTWICDACLLWRCYIIWKEKAWVCIPPALTFLASIAFTIHEMTVNNLGLTPVVIGTRSNPWSVAWILLSVLVNIQATGLIVYRLASSERRFSQVLSTSRKLGHAENIVQGAIRMIVESATPAAVAGIVLGISIAIPFEVFKVPTHSVRLLLLSGVSYALFSIFVALSQQMIIFRVTTGRSWAYAPKNWEDMSGPFGASCNGPHFARTDNNGEITTVDIRSEEPPYESSASLSSDESPPPPILASKSESQAV